jgi:hypothetical protein
MSTHDLIVWPDDTFCFAEELEEFSWKSDDYERIPFGTDRWHRECARLGAL